MLRYLSLLACVLSAGCAVMPEIAHQPTFHNPFPQLSKVAIAPFFNLSHEPTLDGRRVAMAYYHELQSVPGFEVVPVGVVETAMRQYHISLQNPADARRLAQLLEVDALVVGAVTEYSPYYPPRCGLQVEWYAANPCFHPIPPGYGLPWGTPEEEQLPAPLVFEAEMALAKAQMATQTPPMEKMPVEPPPPEGNASEKKPTGGAATGPDRPNKPEVPGPQPPADWSKSGGKDGTVKPLQYRAPVEGATAGGPTESPQPGPAPPGFPADWPDPRGFIPRPPTVRPPTCWPSDAPVIRHTRTYNGADAEFTEALNTYVFFRNDARQGGWQSYLERSDDFIRFCCRMHVCETLTARGGAGESRVVLRWPGNR